MPKVKRIIDRNRFILEVILDIIIIRIIKLRIIASRARRAIRRCER